MQRQQATAASAKAASDMANRRTMVDWQKHAEQVDEARAHLQRVGREIVIVGRARFFGMAFDLFTRNLFTQSFFA